MRTEFRSFQILWRIPAGSDVILLNMNDTDLELLVNDPSQLGKLLEEAPETIVARTAEPIPTPDGRWLRVYTLADGSVQSYSDESPNQAFTGNLQFQIVKPRP